MEITNETNTLDVYYGNTTLDISCDSTDSVDSAGYYLCIATIPDTNTPQSPVVNLRFISTGSISGVQYKIKNITLDNPKGDFFKDDESASEEDTQ